MKLHVVEEITSMDLKDEIIDSLQTEMSLGRYNLKLKTNQTRLTLKTAESNGFFSKTHIEIRFDLLQILSIRKMYS